MKDEDTYRQIMIEVGLEPKWIYHNAFRESYAIYLQGLVSRFLEGIKFKRVVCVFLDNYTWNKTDNLTMPLPYQLTRHISDFAEMLWAGTDSMEDVVNNVECFMQLLNFMVPKTGEHVPVILFNLFPLEGMNVTALQASHIANAVTLKKYKTDYWLEDLHADLEFLKPHIGEAEKLVLFAVPEAYFNTWGYAVVALGHLPFMPINRFEAMNCGGKAGIDPKRVKAFLQTLGENPTYVKKEYAELMSRIKKDN